MKRVWEKEIENDDSNQRKAAWKCLFFFRSLFNLFLFCFCKYVDLSSFFFLYWSWVLDHIHPIGIFLKLSVSILVTHLMFFSIGLFVCPPPQLEICPSFRSFVRYFVAMFGSAGSAGSASILSEKNFPSLLSFHHRLSRRQMLVVIVHVCSVVYVVFLFAVEKTISSNYKRKTQQHQYLANQRHIQW